MKIKTAIIGYGRNGSTMHALPISSNDDFELCAVCDTEKEKLDAAREKYGCRVYLDYKEMLRQEELDFVVVVTRSSQHSYMACDCLLSGKNVLVTKPWATNSLDVQKMTAYAAVSGKKLLPWLPARFGDILVRIREIVDSGEIGKVFQVKRLESTFGLRSDWQTLSEYGGGYLLNWGPHVIDQPLALFDSPVKSVYSEQRQVIMPGDTEDDYYVIMKTENEITFQSEFRISVSGMPNWVVMGDRGTIFAYNNKIITHKVTLPESVDPNNYRGEVDAEVQEETIEKPRYYGDEFKIYKHIASVLKGEEEYSISLETALQVNNIIDAAKQSGKTGQVIFL